ncbi:hypothetical protein VIGAN_08004800, partial [Vigna angularis var. angularis]
RQREGNRHQEAQGIWMCILTAKSRFLRTLLFSDSLLSLALVACFLATTLVSYQEHFCILKVILKRLDKVIFFRYD